MSNLKIKLLRIRVGLLKVLDQKKVFLATVLISYIIAIIIGITCALLSPKISFNEGIFYYGEYKEKVNLSLYLLFHVSAIVAPTSITFSGTILILQNNHQSILKTTILFIIMVIMVVLSICLQLIDNLSLLITSASLIMALNLVSIGLSWTISKVSQIEPFHKREISDGKMIT